MTPPTTIATCSPLTDEEAYIKVNSVGKVICCLCNCDNPECKSVRGALEGLLENYDVIIQKRDK